MRRILLLILALSLCLSVTAFAAITASFDMTCTAGAITGPGDMTFGCVLEDLNFGEFTGISSETGGLASATVDSVRFAFFAPYDEYELSDGNGHTIPLWLKSDGQYTDTEEFFYIFTEADISLLPVHLPVTVSVFQNDWDGCPAGTYTGFLLVQGIWIDKDGVEYYGDVQLIRMTAVKDDPNHEFDVTLKGAAGGAVTADKAKAKAGETVTLTAVPGQGCTLIGFEINGAQAQQAGENTWTFTMPAQDVVITPRWSFGWTALQALINGGASDDTIILNADCVAPAGSAALTVPQNAVVTIDLNGYTIDRALTNPTANGSVFINNGSLTILDSSEGGAGKVTGGRNTDGGGAIVNNDTLTIKGGAFTGNSAKEAGAVYNPSGSVFDFVGGSLSGNTVTTYGGGGVVNYGVMSMNGGTISGNTVPMNGGGIWTAGSLTLSGGVIRENVLTGNNSNGGGIYFKSGDLKILGSPVVQLNEPNDLHMLASQTVTVKDSLDGDAYIGVSKEGALPSRITSGLSGRGTVGNFFSSDRRLCPETDENGELILRRYLFEIGSVTGGMVTADKSDPAPDEIVVFTIAPDEGMKLKSLTYTVTYSDGYSWDSEIRPDDQGVYSVEVREADMRITPVFVPDVLEYDLWLGDTQVSEANKGNILGSSGKVTAAYDPQTHTLTLDKPTITGENDYHSLIYAEGQDLVIVAKNALTLEGENRMAIWVRDGDLTLRGTITANSDYDAAIYAGGSYEGEGGNLVIEGNVTARNTNDYYMGKYINLYAVYADNEITVASTGSLTADAPTYALISDNGSAISLLGSSVNLTSGRTAAYTSGPMTISCNASFQGNDRGGLRCGDLTIMSGTVIASSNGDPGIDAYGDALISGGSLTISSQDDVALNIDGNLTITGGTVSASGSYKAGVRVGRDALISGGNVTTTSTDDDGMEVYGNLRINGGALSSEGADRGLNIDGKLIISSNVTASGAGYGAVIADSGIGGPFLIREPEGAFLNEEQTKVITGYDEGGDEIVALRVVFEPDPSLVAYVDARGIDQNPIADFTLVTEDEKRWVDGWYVVKDDVIIDDSLSVNSWEDGANLILCDGATLTVTNGIAVSNNDGGKGLTIWAQSGGTGKLVSTSDERAGIGSAYYSPGPITINGGVITAQGAMKCAGIGGGSGGGPGGVITINGGTVNAAGGFYAAGIGGGYYSKDWSGDGGTITITGGTVNAAGGHYAAGIGGSYQGGGGTITITGGTVNTTPGLSTTGIGCGQEGSGGTITLSYDERRSTRVTAESYSGMLKLEKPFQDANDETIFWATQEADNAALAGRTLIPAVVIIPDYGTPDFTLPEAIAAIEDNAFEGAAMSVVYVPDGCMSIGAYAFKNCESLSQIRIPANCAVGTDAFEGCNEVFVYGYAGSSAEDYCDSHDNCWFVEIGSGEQ